MLIDGLLAEFFKTGREILVPFLVALFNFIFEKGTYPTQWAVSMLTLLYKGGNSADLNNFRDISILSSFGKMFDIILNNRFKKWEDEHEILCPEQAGFRSGFSTCDNIHVSEQHIRYNRPYM